MLRQAIALFLGTGVVFASPVVTAQTESSTTAKDDLRFPEEGGGMQRSEMPVGGVDDGMPRTDTPQEKVDDGGLPRAGMPVGGVDNKPRPEPPAPKPAEPARTNIDGFGRMPRANMPVGDIDGPVPIRIHWGGYFRLLGEAVENDDLPFIGRNDGFRISNARLAIDADIGDKLYALISVEGALGEAQDRNDPNQTLTVSLRDAFLDYDFSPLVAARLGRFKAPYDLGELEPTARRVFIDRPIESRGVVATRGLEVSGMTQDRQIGLMLYRNRMGLTDDSFDLGFAVALTNGRTSGLALNDNEAFAVFARAMLHYGEYVSLNVAGFLDNRTVGELPNLFDEDVQGFEGSLSFTLGDLRLEGQLLIQRTEFPTTGVETTTARGWHAQWSYQLWKIRFGYRYGWYDPNDRFDVDRVSEHTVALSYIARTVPLLLTIEGTKADEQRDLTNNRLDVLLQLDF